VSQVRDTAVVDFDRNLDYKKTRSMKVLVPALQQI